MPGIKQDLSNSYHKPQDLTLLPIRNKWFFITVPAKIFNRVCVFFYDDHQKLLNMNFYVNIKNKFIASKDAERRIQGLLIIEYFYFSIALNFGK